MASHPAQNVRPETLSVEGVVTSGLGRGAEFLKLEWVQRELRQKAAIQPFPGTLNLRIPADVWAALYARRNDFLMIGDAAPGNCPGYLKRVSLRAGGMVCSFAYFILPEMTAYHDVLEIIASENLREKLQLQDGDPVHVEELPNSVSSAERRRVEPNR